MSNKEQEIKIKISGNVDPSFNKSLSAASAKLEEIGKSTGDTSKSFSDAEKSGVDFGEKSSDAISTLDAVLASAGISAALTGIESAFEECVKAADEYETALAKVSTIADTSQKSMSEIKSEISALSSETGQSVTDISEAAYQAISASVDTADAVDFVNKANMLAVGGFTDVTSAVDVLTTAINAYGLESSEASRISDMLVQTQNLGKTTVNELAQSLGTVIPIASAYNVNMENISAAYAELTKNGIDTANAGTYIRATLNELADSGSAVSEILYEKTGKSFSMLMDSSKSLGDVIEVLGNSVNGDSTAFANLWGNVRASTGALSIFTSGSKAFNETLGDMESSAGSTAKAYDKVTSTAEYAEKVFQNSANNLQIAIGEKLSPAIEGLYETGSDILDGITAFVDANPEVVGAVTALTVGVGVFTGAIALYTIGTKAAAVATTALTAVMDANPFFLVATAITALVAGTVVMVASQEDAADEMDGMSASTKLQYERLEDLNKEYDRMCEQGKKNTAEAQLLKAEIDELSSSYENTKQSMEEFTDSCRESINAFYETHNEYYKGVQSINDEEEASGNLITRLDELASKSNLTAEEQAEMASVIDLLNSKMPTLGLSISEVGENTQSVIDKLKELSSKQVAESRYENAQKSYNELLKEQPDLLDKSKAAAQQVTDAQSLYNEKVSATAKAQEEYNEALERYGGDDMSGTVAKYALALSEAGAAEATALDDYNTAYQTFIDTKNAYNQNLRDSDVALEEYSDAFAEKNGIVIDSADETQQAVSSAAMGIESVLQDLAAKYDEVYQSALNSIQGQYALWDEVDDVSATSASALMSNLDSQITYWQNYADNLESLQNRNIEGLDKLLASMDDGSEKSAAAPAGMANASDSELKKMVDKYSELQDEQDRTAGNVADLETDFSDKMDKIAEDTAKTIDEMNLSEEAKTAATETMNAYIKAIRSADVEGAVSEKISGAKSLLNLGANRKGIVAQFQAIEQNAKGTKRSADIFIAGEEGPELIVNAGGSQVFTADETKQILNGNSETDSSGSSLTAILNIPELISQILDGSAKDRLSIEDIAGNIMNDSQNNYDNSVSSVTYSPTYQINSDQGSSVIEAVKKAEKMSQEEFAKMMKQYNKSVARKSF